MTTEGIQRDYKKDTKKKLILAILSIYYTLEVSFPCQNKGSHYVGFASSLK